MTLSEFDIWYRTRYRRTSSALTSTALAISDMLGVMASFGWGFFWVRLYYLIFFDYGGINFKSFVTYWPYLPAFLLFFQIFNLYPGVSLAPAEELKRFTIGAFMAYGGIIMSRYIEKEDWDSITAAFIISFIFSTPILLTARSITHWLLHKTRLGGVPAVIFGSGSTGRLVIDRLHGSIRTGYVPVLILDDEAGGIDNYKGIPIIHDTSLGPEIVKRYNIKMAIVATHRSEPDSLKKLLNNSISAFRYNVLIPDFFNVTNVWMTVRDFDGVLGFMTSHELKMPWNIGIKRFMDFTAVFIGGIILLPFLLLIALLVKITSRGPVLYGHKRLGKNGKPFYAYKFRSMVIDSEERLKILLESDPAIRREWEENHKLKNDPRVTKIGKILRRLSFDEFPQLINILKGEMSLVGPRPITEKEVEKYGEDFDRIFSVLPGLTGLWQVSGRSETDYAARVSYDTYYLQSWSGWLDIWVIFKTFGAVIRGKGAY
ncbi:MAG: undecaprenyl-phosphate galactose phosphotransferase WbaP [Treponema sp.]|nr:undecaprenyl-phosphate galactose phosphotransferase WbaP [Treponema sp.]